MSELNDLAAQSGRGPDELLQDALAGYFDELVKTRDMLDGRYDELKSGRAKPIGGEEALPTSTVFAITLARKTPTQPIVSSHKFLTPFAGSSLFFVKAATARTSRRAPCGSFWGVNT